ncbi:MAG: hypothetical protein KF875_14965 [Trueperaceae bacterium]|nr:hypothetical protein [Trueperaceae bacterium]MCO5173069.1 hypothetical protein [Trueperaceae bacterium]
MHVSSTKVRRLQRVFREDGRTLIVAMDHGSYMNVLPQAADPGRILDEVREAGADAVLTTLGIATTYTDRLGGMGLILRLDGSGSMLDQGSTFEQRYTIEDGLRVAADAVAAMGFPGEGRGETLHNLGRIASQCTAWNMPLLAEMMPGGFNPSLHTPENITLASRIGVELGADIIKTTYTGDVESFKALTAGVFAPVVVLGGNRKGELVDLLTMVHDSLQGGASGVAVGRNVWQHENAGGVVRALARIIHDGATVAQAAKELGSR